MQAEPIRIFEKLKKDTEMRSNIRAKLIAAEIITVTIMAAKVYWALPGRLCEPLASMESLQPCEVISM